MSVSEAWTDPVANHDLAAAQKVSEAIWDQVMSNILYAGRRAEPPLTNKSGGAATAGDVYVPDSANASAMTTTTTPGHPGPVGVARESIANNASGRYAFIGPATVKVTGTVAVGDYLETSSTAGSAKSVGPIKTPRAFAKAITASSGGYCTALLLPTAAGGPIIKTSRGATISNSTTDTVLLTMTVPAKLLETGFGIRIRHCGAAVFNGTGGGEVSLKVKYGGTTLVSLSPATGSGHSQAATVITHDMIATLMNEGVANAQRCIMQTIESANSYLNRLAQGTSAIDSTADQTLQVTAQLSTANATTTFTEYFTYVELIAAP